MVFLSSAGTAYGKDAVCPIREDTETNSINSYGLHKISIEKLLYLFWYTYQLDYRIIRLSNPYGPYQIPNGIQGVVTTFTYKAIKNSPIVIYGDGSIIRDFIYIDDAVDGIFKIVFGSSKHKLYNWGSGYGVSIKEVISKVQHVLSIDLILEYKPSRRIDVPINILDISRYEKEYGKLNAISLEEGIASLIEFATNIMNSVLKGLL